MSVYIAGLTPALKYTAKELLSIGITVTDTPCWKTTDILLDIPSIRPGGMEPKVLDTLLSSLPQNVRVWGGNFKTDSHLCVDLLKDESYLWENAAITARCTLNLAEPMLHQDWAHTNVLIIGWGRIGTWLAKLLKELQCNVTVAVRRDDHLHRLRALGYRAEKSEALHSILPDIDAVINTVPFPVLPSVQFPKNCLKLDLASQKGLSGEDVIWARGLPGTHAPAESGKLIAETFLRIRKELES